MAQRETPINEITALMNGSQVAKPTWTATPTASVAAPDISGLISNNYNQQVSQSNALLGGLASLGGTVATAGMKYSDERLKDDIKPVGKLDDGTPIVTYRYKPETGLGGGLMQLGVIAQDVKKRNPDAVKKMPSGYLAVDMEKVLGA
jgi:hypothetical protein